MDGLERQITRHEFARRAARVWEQQRRLVDEQRRKREEKELRGEDDFADIAQAAALATEAQVAAFSAQLDIYDASVIEALRANERELERVGAEVDALLEQAYLLPDGRRVFMTEDGQRVFDENGAEIGPEDIDPREIGDHRPSWEAFRETLDEQSDLTAEREELFDFQSRLDDARDRLDDEGLTSDELEDIGAELEAAMPPAVREILDRTGRVGPAQSADAETSGPAHDADPASVGRRSTATPFQPR